MSPSAETNGHTNGASNGNHSALDWNTFANVIDGELSTTSKTRTGINPATGEPNEPVPVSTPEDVDRALEAAKRAFPGWAETPYEERRKAVNAFADAIEAEKENFSKLLVKEQGKPVSLRSPIAIMVGVQHSCYARSDSHPLLNLDLLCPLRDRLHPADHAYHSSLRYALRDHCR